MNKDTVSWEEKHKNNYDEWTPEVVYKVYRNDDLDTFPTQILEDMLKHLDNKLKERLQDKIDNANTESEDNL